MALTSTSVSNAKRRWMLRKAWSWLTAPLSFSSTWHVSPSTGRRCSELRSTTASLSLSCSIWTTTSGAMRAFRTSSMRRKSLECVSTARPRLTRTGTRRIRGMPRGPRLSSQKLKYRQKWSNQLPMKVIFRWKMNSKHKWQKRWQQLWYHPQQL